MGYTEYLRVNHRIVLNLQSILTCNFNLNCNIITWVETMQHSISGHIPYHQWNCLSPKCFALLVKHAEDNSTFYSRETMCDNDLKSGVDFIWTASRTSFSLEWGLYCSGESRVAMAKSFFFAGAVLGSMVSLN